MNDVRFIALILLLLGMVSCNKSLDPIFRTDIDFEYERDEFSDTLYRIRTLNVTSTNDSVLSMAHAKIQDENGLVLLDDAWKSIRGQSFALEERRVYDVKLTVYYPFNQEEIFTDTISIDNRDLPKYIQINSISIISDVLQDNYLGESVSNIYVTLLQIMNDIDFHYYEAEYFDDENILYFDRSFPPRSISFNLNNVQLPIKTFDQEINKIYNIEVSYPLVVGTTLTNERDVNFKLNMEQLIIEFGVQPGTVFTTDSYGSSSGGEFTGTLNFEWIYE